MADDIRISATLPQHPKTIRLERELGAIGCWCLVKLFLWAGENRPNGSLRGLSDEDLEIAVGWNSKRGLIPVLSKLRFLDGKRGDRCIHDWAAHQPYVTGRPERIAQARAAAEARWNKSKGHAPSMLPACAQQESAMPPSLPAPPAPSLPTSPKGNDDDKSASLPQIEAEHYSDRLDRHLENVVRKFQGKGQDDTFLKAALALIDDRAWQKGRRVASEAYFTTALQNFINDKGEVDKLTQRLSQERARRERWMPGFDPKAHSDMPDDRHREQIEEARAMAQRTGRNGDVCLKEIKARDAKGKKA